MLLSLQRVPKLKEWLCWYLQLKWHLHFRLVSPSQLMQKYVRVYKVTHYFFWLIDWLMCTRWPITRWVFSWPKLFGLVLKYFFWLLLLKDHFVVRKLALVHPMIFAALTNPGSECLDFKAMHDGVKSQKEKCTKVPTWDPMAVSSLRLEMKKWTILREARRVLSETQIIFNKLTKNTKNTEKL